MVKKNICISLGLTLLLSACSAGVVKSHKTKITSKPAGATVYASGVKIGKTPLVIDPNDTFPPSWQNWEYQASGVLSMKMPGCEEYTRRVNDAFLYKDINVQLKCEPIASGRPPASSVNKTEAPMEPDTQTVTSQSGKQVTEGSIEARLIELRHLYQKGLITEDEYNATRRRILKEL